jgi:thioester reductase-like protein
VGDLEAEKLGMSESDWVNVAKEADVIVHNGALVSLTFTEGMRILDA